MILHGLIVTVHILVCFFIIVVVLLQSGKSGDISAAFGGQGSQTAFGPRGAASALSRATTWSAVLFLVTSITLSIYAAGHSGPKSVLEGMKSQPVKTQPATPAPVKPTQKKAGFWNLQFRQRNVHRRCSGLGAQTAIFRRQRSDTSPFDLIQEPLGLWRSAQCLL
jgi:preprotein translocase subunit SecG